MSKADWKVVRVVVYPPGSPRGSRLERDVSLPWDAGFEDLLAALALQSPEIHTEVRSCMARASSGFSEPENEAATAETLGHYFSLGSSIVCPDISAETA